MASSSSAAGVTEGGVLVPSALDIVALVALVFVGSAFVRFIARRLTRPAAIPGGQKKRLPKAQ
jgi:hypothetical protein